MVNANPVNKVVKYELKVKYSCIIQNECMDGIVSGD